MTAPKISLRQQVEAVRFAETRQRTLCGGGSVKDLRRQPEREFDLNRLNAAARTLEWLANHEGEIRAFVALPAEAQKAVLAWGETIAESQILAGSAPKAGESAQ